MKSSTTVGVAKRSRPTFAKLVVGLLVGLVVGFIPAFTAPAAAGQIVTTTYPTICGKMICPFPLPVVWIPSVQYTGITCALPGVTCPTATSGRAVKDGAFVEAESFSGVASVAATTSLTLTTPTGVQFVYNGAAGNQPDTVTFTIDRAADTQSLLALGGTATMSVYLDDLTAGTSLTVVSARPIETSSAFVTDPTVSVDPTQLTLGHTYSARVVTSVSQPVGVLPSTTVFYRNFNLTATADVPVVDTPMINGEALGWMALAALVVGGGVVAVRRRRAIS